MLTKAWIINLLALASFNTYAQSIDFAYGNYQSAPYVYMNASGQMHKGIMFDISQALSKQLSLPVKLVNLPRKRTEDFLAEGQVDVRCHLSPLWVKQPHLYDWTGPLYQLNTIIIGLRSAPASITSLNDLIGKNVGVVLGYRYNDELNQLVDNQQITIVKSKSLRSALLMLGKKRVDFVIGNHILANYLINELGLNQQEVIHPYVVRTQPIHCAISKKSKLAPSNLINALEQMKTSGAFEVILQTYFKDMNH